MTEDLWTIALHLPSVRMSGLRAWRWRQRMGLAPGVLAATDAVGSRIATTVNVDFAEAYFDDESTVITMTTTLNDLEPGDVQDVASSSYLVEWYTDVHRDRIRDLWIACWERQQRQKE